MLPWPVCAPPPPMRPVPEPDDAPEPSGPPLDAPAPELPAGGAKVQAPPRAKMTTVRRLGADDRGMADLRNVLLVSYFNDNSLKKLLKKSAGLHAGARDCHLHSARVHE